MLSVSDAAVPTWLVALQVSFLCTGFQQQGQSVLVLLAALNPKAKT